MRKKVQAIIANPLFSGSAIMILGSNSASVLNYLYHFIIGRMLSPGYYGELASLISVMGLLGIIPAALCLVIVKQISSAKDDEETLNLVKWFQTKIFIIAVIIAFFVLIASPFIASFLHINKISYFFLIVLTCLFSIQTAFNRSILQGVLKFKEMVVSLLTENVSKLLISILLIYLGFSVGGAMWAFVLSSLIGFYLTNIFLRIRNICETKIGPDIRQIIKFTIPVVVYSFSTTSIYSSDLILVKHFFSSHDAGIYASLSTLGKIIFFGTGPIGAVMFPLVSKRSATGKPHQKIFILSFLATLILALIILGIYFLIPEIAIKMLYGSAYLGAASLLVWFGLFISFFTLSSLIINYCLSLGNTRVVFLPLFASIIQIVAIYFFHQTLFTVILVSTLISALLLMSLLIYSICEKQLFV